MAETIDTIQLELVDSVPSSCVVCQEKQNLLELSCGKHHVCRTCMKGKTWHNTRPDSDDIFSCAECSRQKSICPSVYAFMDNSNVWIEAKNLKDNPQIRVDAGQLLKLIESNRIVAKATLYGSEPPPVDTVWLKIREAGWDLDIKERSLWTNKEKKVDTQIVADATMTICDKASQNNILVIVSGDADMMPVIEKAKERKWQVEVYTWKNAVSSEIKKDFDIKVYYLDDFEDKILFVDIKRLPLDEMQRVASRNGVVCKIKPNAFGCKMESNADVKQMRRYTPSMPFIEWYKEIKKKFEVPFQCFQLPEELEADENMLCLVFDIKEAGSDKVTEIIDSHAVTPISKISDEKIQTYLQYEGTIRQKIAAEEEESLGNCKTPQALTRQYCQQLSAEDQTNEGDRLDEDCDNGHQDGQKYECNDQLVTIKPAAEHKTENDHSDLDIKSKIRSQPATVSDHCDDDEADKDKPWETVKSKTKQKKNYQQYSSLCRFGKDCRFGSKCTYKHTKEEKDFFRDKPVPAAKDYKTKPNKNQAQRQYRKQPQRN